MRYKILDQNGLNHLTLTIVEWIDLFTRPVYSETGWLFFNVGYKPCLPMYLQQAGDANIRVIAVPTTVRESASKPWVVENGGCMREQGKAISEQTVGS